MPSPLPFPSPAPVPLADALRWPAGGDWLFDVKEDGFRARLAGGALTGRAKPYCLPGALPAVLTACDLDGEWLPRPREFVAFDVVTVHGQNIAREPLHFRRRALADLVREANWPWLRLIEATRGDGGEFLETVIARGGEGVVAKNIHAPYGVDWFKGKREETHDCLVLEIHQLKQSIRLGELDASGAVMERGWCPVFGGDGCAFWKNRRVDELKVGDMVEILCHRIQASGKFREPRFVRQRADLPPTDAKGFAAKSGAMTMVPLSTCRPRMRRGSVCRKFPTFFR